MTLRAVIILAIIISIGSGIALVAGVGDTADRVALVLLCWVSISIPVSLGVGRFLHDAPR